MSKWCETDMKETPDRSTKLRAGEKGEVLALAHLQAAGLALVARNFKSPGRGGGEIDLIMRERDGTLVFVEVRQRSHTTYGGAAASVGWTKQRRVIFAARHFLARLGASPPCRFDVIAVQGAASSDSWQVEWLKGAFDATGYS